MVTASGLRDGGKDTSDAHPETPSSSHKRRWYRRPVLVAVLGVVVVAFGIALTWLALAWSDRGAQEASLEDAVESFRREGGDASAGFLRPPGGVYTYEGTGTEQLSVLDTSQRWGPTVPATVTRGEGSCWTFRLEYSNHHSQEWDFCPNEDALTETGGRTDQTPSRRIATATNAPSREIRAAPRERRSGTRDVTGSRCASSAQSMWTLPHRSATSPTPRPAR